MRTIYALALIALLLPIVGCSTYETTKHSNVTPGQRWHAAELDYEAVLKSADNYAVACLSQTVQAKVDNAPKPPCVKIVGYLAKIKSETEPLRKAGDDIYEEGEWTRLESYIPALITAAERIRYHLASKEE